MRGRGRGRERERRRSIEMALGKLGLPNIYNPSLVIQRKNARDHYLLGVWIRAFFKRQVFQCQANESLVMTETF